MSDKDVYMLWQRSPLEFIHAMWGIKPQPILPEHSDLHWRDLKYEHFSPFMRGKHITWQQYLILKAVEEAMNGNASRWISVASGRGIGKSCVMAWILLWFLFCHPDCQVPCTAPSADQMYDVLWKEVAKWLQMMPKEVQDYYEWQRSYVRMSEKPEVWFARARTARKENPEALAGVHADDVAILVDEASGIDDIIYQTAEGTLTNENILMIMISNPRRLHGYFYDSHHRMKHDFQTFQFDSRESPVVDREYVNRMGEKYGEESDAYSIEVKGEFPKEDAVDTKGYVPLLLQSDLRETSNAEFVGDLRMGVDPSGEGDDESVWIIRNQFKAKVVGREKISNSQSIASRTMELIDYYEINPSFVYVDNFGEGANVAQHLAAAQRWVSPVNMGESPEDTDVYLNKRAEAYWRLKEWIRQGGELVNHSGWQELLTIRYRRNLKGKLQIMPKHDMRREGYPSPNIADALMLTFYEVESNTRSESPIYHPTQDTRLG